MEYFFGKFRFNYADDDSLYLYIFYSDVFMNRIKEKEIHSIYFLCLVHKQVPGKKAFHSSVLPMFIKDSNKHVYVN